MLRKLISATLVLGTLGACAVAPDQYKIGTRGGEDFYAFDVNGPSKKSYDIQLKHWASQFCPQGYRVVDSQHEMTRASRIHHEIWYKVTIACPAR